MSGAGAPQLGEMVRAGAKVTIVAASWHTEVMSALIAGAQRACSEAGAICQVQRVPGSFELPLVAQRAAGTSDAVVVLGVVIRGETPHFDYVCSGVTHGIMTVMLSTDTPIGFGVLTCDTQEQAVARSGLPGSQEDKGYEATIAALALLPDQA